MSEVHTPDGGPAFPPPEAAYAFIGVETGMSLRDYFAAKAMAALMEMDGIQYANRTADHAVVAYKQADAMLAARAAIAKAEPSENHNG